MEENNFNQNLNTSDSNETHKKPVGPIIGIAIIVVIMIFGGLYYWGAQISKQNKVKQENLTAEQIGSQTDNAALQLQAQSQSDEIADIETDLNTTDLENLDQELENIDLEFNF